MSLWWPVTPRPGNYGDLIGPWLFKEMTGRPARRGACGADGVIHSVGSIAAKAGPGCIIWGSGTIRQSDVPNPKADYRAVRGPLTRKAVLRAGGACPAILGDPGLLLPQFISPDPPCHRVGILAHYVDESDVRTLYDGVEDVTVISMLTGDVREKTAEILSCRHLLTSSLHGLVVAHAYGRPVRWVILSDKVIGDGWEFRDYLQGLEHEPLDWRSDTLRLTADQPESDTLVQDPAFDAEAVLAVCPWTH